MNTVDYRLPKGDLASRNLAIPQRLKIETLLQEGISINIDLAGVQSLSESYSDEIFGVLVVKHGKAKVLRSLKIINASPSILKSIAKVIQRRSNELQSKKQSDAFSSNPAWVVC